MYFGIVFLIGFFSLALIKISKRGIVNLSGVFVLVWMICLGFASMSLFGMQELADEVKIIGLLVMPIFSINALLFPIDKKTAVRNDEYTSRMSYANNRLLIAATLIVYIVSFRYLRIAVANILNGNLYWLRAASYESSTGYMTTSMLTVYQSMIRPLLITMIILTVIDYSRGVGKPLTLILSLINIILYSLLFVGRYMIFESLIILFAGFYTKQISGIIRFIKNHKKLFWIGVAGFILIVNITNLRSHNSIIRSIYVYFCGSFGFLTTLINRNIGLDLHLNGRALFGFIYNTMWLFASLVGLVPSRGSASYQITQLTGTTMSIGTGMSYNSLATFLHPLMADFGKWGCLLGVFIFAFLVNWIEKKRYRSNNTFWTAIYIEMVYVMINCVLQYSFLNASYAFLIFYLFIFTNKFRFKH